MRTLIVIGLSALLSGCGLSNPILKSEIVSYDDVIEGATDKLLVLNILRARDQAPLHFMALPSLRQVITQNNSLSLLELTGPRNGSTQRSTATLGMSFQVSPSFDLNHIYTKEFVTGMTSPIDPKYVKYWIDRGFDKRIVMLLFFSSVEITQGKGALAKKIVVTNSPKESVEQIRSRVRNNERRYCEGKSQFERYISVINRIKTFSAKMSSKQKLMGCVQYDAAQASKFLQALAAAEQSKIKYKYLKKSKIYKLSSASEESRVLFCLGGSGGKSHSASLKAGEQTMQAEDSLTCDEPDEDAVDEKDCPTPPVPGAKAESDISNKAKTETSNSAADTSDKNKEPAAGKYCEFFGPNDEQTLDMEKFNVKFTIRSVGEMIHFLGDLLYYQEALKSDSSLKSNTVAGQPAHHDLHNPVTLGYCRDDPPTSEEDARGTSDILFNVSGDMANARFTVPYRDKTYSVGNYLTTPTTSDMKTAVCRNAHTDRKDHTLEVLSVVQALTNLHQSATDIRTTPAVQVVP